MNAISTREPQTAALSFADIERLGDHIAKSNLFGMKTKEQAIVLMAIAQAEGRHPVLAARDYDIIQGRPSKKAEAMLRDFIEAGGKVQWHKLDDAAADATFSHPAGGSTRINWDLARANAAGLAGKDMWKKYPRQMLRSRTVSEGVRTVYPLATSGMHVPEEVADFTGPTIDAEPQDAGNAPRRVRHKATVGADRPEQTATPDPGGNGAEPPPPPTWLEHYTNKLTNERSLSNWIITFEDACATASSQPDLVRLMGIDVIKRALAKGSAEIKQRITQASSAAFTRLTPTQAAMPLSDEPWKDEDLAKIDGEERLHA